MYQDSSQISFVAPVQYESAGRDHYRLPSHNSTSHKQDDHPHADGEDAFRSSGPGLFINLSGASANPLFSHDRHFINAFAQQLSNNALESGVFSPTGQSLDFGQLSGNGRDQQLIGSNPVKLESNIYDGLENESPVDIKEGTFGARAFWGAPNPETDLPLQRNIHHDGLNI